MSTTTSSGHSPVLFCLVFLAIAQIWSPEEQQRWKYWVPVVISWAPAELGRVAKAELHSRCVASSAFLWPHYQVSGVQSVKTTCNVAEALFNKVNYTLDNIYHFSFLAAPEQVCLILFTVTVQWRTPRCIQCCVTVTL